MPLARRRRECTLLPRDSTKDSAQSVARRWRRTNALNPPHRDFHANISPHPMPTSSSGSHQPYPTGASAYPAQSSVPYIPTPPAAGEEGGQKIH
jgi:hypothetical protein